MSGKYTNKKKKSNAVPILIGIVAVLVIGIMLLVLFRPQAEPEAETTVPTQPGVTVPATFAVKESTEGSVTLPYELGKGLVVTSISNYAGIYMEDGTDETVSGILKITLENTSDEDLQLARVQLEYADQTAVFQVTNLPAGKEVVTLEQNRMAYTTETPALITADSVAFVSEFPLCEDKLQITTMDGAINIKNISGGNLSGNIYVYYKNVAGGTYYGGITYRISLEGGLKENEVRQIMSAHFDAENSEIVMVGYSG